MHKVGKLNDLHIVGKVVQFLREQGAVLTGLKTLHLRKIVFVEDDNDDAQRLDRCLDRRLYHLTGVLDVTIGQHQEHMILLVGLSHARPFGTPHYTLNDLRQVGGTCRFY